MNTPTFSISAANYSKISTFCSPVGKTFSITSQDLVYYFQGSSVKIPTYSCSIRGYGCPSLEEIKEFNRLYYDHLEESGKRGEIPDNLAIEVSSPGAGRLLRVPDDLERFKDLPLTLKYLERDAETKKVTGKREGVFFLVSIDNDSKHCVWKLADVKENWDPLMKRKTLSRKNKDWRLDLPFQNIKKLTFYLKL